MFHVKHPFIFMQKECVILRFRMTEKKEWYIEEMYDCYNNSKYQVYYPSKDWIESQRLELGDSQNLEDFGLLLPKDLAE